MDVSLANRIARECLAKFDGLPKTGKPSEEFEWTILAAIVLVVRTPEDAEKPPCTVRVVALGTGTKCLGGPELSPRGDLVHDSHAEVLARRAFLRYLMEQIEAAAAGGEAGGVGSIFVRTSAPEEGKFVLREGHSFHFFTTHSPCGDASIFGRAESSVEGTDGNVGAVDETPPRKRCRIEAEPEESGSVLEAEGGEKPAAGMTGGKLLAPESGGDLMAQTIGAVRTKPGRGDRTLSVSCSDKMARWNVLGVQGALLMLLLARPIYLEGIVLCDGTDHSVEALRRALWGRFDRMVLRNTENGILEQPFRQGMPVVVAATNGQMFRFRKNRKPRCADGKYQPSPCGIVWCDVSQRPHEVEVSGRRHGVTKRKLTTPAARLQISKIELFTRFARIYRSSRVRGERLNNTAAVQQQQQQQHHPETAEIDHQGNTSLQATDTSRDPSAAVGAKKGDENQLPHRGDAIDISQLSYVQAKALSEQYTRQWDRVRKAAFGRWTVKPAGLGQFFVDDRTNFGQTFAGSTNT